MEADVIGLGSILGFVPEGIGGTVLGSGFLAKHQRRRFERADIRVVRGRLTAERCGAPASVTLGDPGLLVRPFAPSELRPRTALGIIPHFADRNEPALASLSRRFGAEAVVIDVRQSPERVLAEMSRCAFIASSSLHGLVAADALGLPNVWIVLSDRVIGRGFKFRDYFSAFGGGAPKRKPRRLRGDEKLSWLLGKMVRPGAAVEDGVGRLDEVFRGLTAEGLIARRSAGAENGGEGWAAQHSQGRQGGQA